MSATVVALQERAQRDRRWSASDRVVVTGATGFVGSRLIRKLVDLQVPVRAVVRSSPAAAPLRRVGCEVAIADVEDVPSLAAAFAECRAVVHLVAILREKGHSTYEAINRIGTANVVAAAYRAGVGRIVHMSALGAHPYASRYLQSKWAGEEEVRRGDVPYAIFRPSILFGPHGGAAKQFVDLVRLGVWYPFRRGRLEAVLARLAEATPIVPVLGSGQARFMPVHIDDVLEAVSQAIHRDDVLGETYEIGGPDIVTYEGILVAIAERLNLRRWVVHVPLAVAWIIVRLGAFLPDPPITADEFASLLHDNVCDSAKVQRVFQLMLRPFRVAIADAVGGPLGAMEGAQGGDGR